MDGIPYYDNPYGKLEVSVELQHAANVMLLDQSNFNAYQRGQKFSYYGGYYTKTPVSIVVNGPGRWYLVVDSDSNEQYRYAWIK